MYSKKERNIVLVVFLILPLLHLFIFSYIPIIFNVYLSLTDWNGINFGEFNFVGLSNYKKIFTDPKYLLLFRNCFYYLIASIPQLLLAFFLALIANGKMRGIGVFKGIIIFPYMLNGIIVSTIFTLFFSPSGTLNIILDGLGLDFLTNNWLQDLTLVNPSLASIGIWRYYGLGFLMFYSALQSIPAEIYQAASIDGCNKMQEIMYICVPYIKKVLFINIILGISGAVQVFEIPYIMLKGGNGTATPVIQVNQSMQQAQYGFASAISIVIFLVIVLAVSIQRKFTKEEE